jgi:hypothetical protein
LKVESRSDILNVNIGSLVIRSATIFVELESNTLGTLVAICIGFVDLGGVGKLAVGFQLLYVRGG